MALEPGRRTLVDGSAVLHHAYDLQLHGSPSLTADRRTAITENSHTAGRHAMGTWPRRQRNVQPPHSPAAGRRHAGTYVALLVVVHGAVATLAGMALADDPTRSPPGQPEPVPGVLRHREVSLASLMGPPLRPV